MTNISVPAELGRFKHRFIRFAKERYPVDRPSLIFIGCLVACWATTYYLMNVVANMASYRSSFIQHSERLPDLGFEVIPEIQELWLTDLFDVLMFAPTAIMATFINRRPNYILVKGLGSSLICNIMRICTVAVTSLPDSRAGCQFVTGDFWTTFRLHRCGDCMFSGHTTIFVLCTMVWVSHAPRNWIGIVCTFLIATVCIAGSLVVVANRAHYTMDILVAWYVSVSVWFTVSHFWDTQVVRRGWLRTINFPNPSLMNNGKVNHMVYAPSAQSSPDILPMSTYDLYESQYRPVELSPV
ncbi:hypothetical protein IWQ60_010053 [Tieghemiomyces parasiticus]|uniref:Sphingomyelin synthase-like domain-containing protein n=1 Tax=Tieghemiomyces parasiticus TaxID=78921 RepID=A0A9W7ZU41_9FUNG|nr:hypothetical protein IWQ60_010053 [Tieghemiomyces parasiticus]